MISLEMDLNRPKGGERVTSGTTSTLVRYMAHFHNNPFIHEYLGSFSRNNEEGYFNI